jgi:uncharacterized protein (DUF1778 family)
VGNVPGRPPSGRPLPWWQGRPHGPVKASPRAASPALTGPVPLEFGWGMEMYVKGRTIETMASKTERLSLRLTPHQDAVLRRAAEARGESANDFVLRHAVEAAEMELADRRAFVADDDAWTELQEMLSREPALPPAMIKLLSNPSVLEQPS